MYTFKNTFEVSKKLLILILTIIGLFITSNPNAYTAGRWERGVKLSGWYNRDPYGNTSTWRTGLDVRLIRTSPFSTWANTMNLEYGEIYSFVTGIPKQISPNTGLITTNYIRNITSFVFWNFYLAGRALISPTGEGAHGESWLTYGKIFSRYVEGGIGIKETVSGKNLDSWLRANIVYRKPFGYRTLLVWSGVYNNNLKTTSINEISSEINLSYKLARRLEFKLNFITVKKSNSDELFRKETVDLVYDLLYSGGKTY